MAASEHRLEGLAATAQPPPQLSRRASISNSGGIPPPPLSRRQSISFANGTRGTLPEGTTSVLSGVIQATAFLNSATQNSSIPNHVISSSIPFSLPTSTPSLMSPLTSPPMMSQRSHSFVTMPSRSSGTNSNATSPTIKPISLKPNAIPKWQWIIGGKNNQVSPSNPIGTTQHSRANSQNTQKSQLYHSQSIFTYASNATNAPLDDVLVRGDVFKLLAFLLHAFGTIQVISYKVGWTGISSGFGLQMLYWTTGLMLLQISRLTGSTILAIYISVIPFYFQLILSRQHYNIISCTWLSALLAIHVQHGSIDFRRHAFFISILYIATHLLADYQINRTADQLVFARPPSPSYLPLTTPISEVTRICFTMAFLIICGAMAALEHFMHHFARTIVDRDRRLRRLRQIHLELQRQITTYRPMNEWLDLQSPSTKVIEMLKAVQDSGHVDDSVVNRLQSVIGLLSSNDFLSPNQDVAQQAQDNEVRQWLNSLLLSRVSLEQTAADKNEPPASGQVSVTERASGAPSVIRPNPSADTTSSLFPSSMDPATLLPAASDIAVREVMRQVDQWDFNIFQLSEVTHKRPLFYLSYALFERYNFFSQFQIDEQVFRHLMARVESGYLDNPYHNNLHAADVMQTVHALITMHAMQDMLTIEDCFIVLFSASVHDLEHPGYNNPFLINSNHYLALRYNDTSVLENYHIARAFDYLMDTAVAADAQARRHSMDQVDGDLTALRTDFTLPSQRHSVYNIFSNMPVELFKKLRSGIVNTVLATDMAKHFEYVGRFRNKISGAGFDFDDPKDRQLLLDVTIKCGDINNPAKSALLAQRWTEAIMNEFYRQGDAERQLGVPISSFMDRTQPNVAKCQIGFIDFIVAPLYEAWDLYMVDDEAGEPHVALDNIAQNKSYWMQQQQMNLSASIPSFKQL